MRIFIRGLGFFKSGDFLIQEFLSPRNPRRGLGFLTLKIVFRDFPRMPPLINDGLETVEFGSYVLP